MPMLLHLFNIYGIYLKLGNNKGTKLPGKYWNLWIADLRKTGTSSHEVPSD